MIQGASRGSKSSFADQIGTQAEPVPAEEYPEVSPTQERKNMREHRRRPRKNTPHHVKVMNHESGRLIGRVVDITADGMMLDLSGEALHTGPSSFDAAHHPAGHDE
jgi:hypothetical protein